jgi:PhnB protein
MSVKISPKKISHIPNGFTSITPYFIVNDAKSFTDFLRKAFDAEIIDEHFENNALRHGAYRVFGSIIEASQASSEFSSAKISIHLYVPDCDEVYANAIKAGGKSIYEVADMPYGERSGGIEDCCGNSWWIATQQIDMYPMF